MKQKQDFAGSRSSEENLSTFITHTHTFQVIELVINTCIYILCSSGKKKDGEIGKQLESANAPIELGCFLYFFIFPRRKVYDK